MNENVRLAMRRARNLIALAGAITVALCTVSQNVMAADPLIFDGRLNEWNAVPLNLDEGGAGEDGINLDSLRVVRAENWLAISYTTGRELVMQSGNSLRMLLDLDGNRDTGVRSGDLGVDMVWDFADRSGSLYAGNVRQPIGTEDVELVIAPAMASTRFEIGMINPLPAGETIGVSIVSREQNGDLLGPEAGLHITPTELPLPDPQLTSKQEASHLRVMLWNCWDDNFRSEPKAFARIVRAASPDLMVLVDVENSDADDIRTVVTHWLGTPDSGPWQVVHRGEDTAIASPSPILGSWEIPGMPRAGAYLLELPAPFDGPVLLLAIHPVCCSNDRLRQRQVDSMLAYIRDVYAHPESLGIDPETPLLIIGDTNLVGWSSQYRGYTEGKIHDEKRYGVSPKTAPTRFPLTDLVSRHTDGPQAYTWRDDTTDFGPARIDCVFYPAEVFGVGTHFIIDTRSMDVGRLGQMGLNPDDSELASDHLPHIVDFYPVDGGDKE